jgi:hypothetical protein
MLLQLDLLSEGHHKLVYIAGHLVTDAATRSEACATNEKISHTCG